MTFGVAAALVVGVAACRPRAPTGPFVVVARFPHDSAAYTQGLLRVGDVLYESTGLYGYSDLRRADLRTGRVLAAVALPPDRFGEGLALLQNRLYQLTWQSHVGYVYDRATLARVDSFPYAGEGWGLATDDTSLIMSDGSDSLRWLSPTTFRVRRVVHVRYQGQPLYRLNELELIGPDLFANVYQSNWILRIDPVTGVVRELLDFGTLYPADRRWRWADVMNGIAAGDSGTLLLTGKDWPVLFQVRLRSPGRPGS